MCDAANRRTICHHGLQHDAIHPIYYGLQKLELTCERLENNFCDSFFQHAPRTPHTKLHHMFSLATTDLWKNHAQ